MLRTTSVAMGQGNEQWSPHPPCPPCLPCPRAGRGGLELGERLTVIPEQIGSRRGLGGGWGGEVPGIGWFRRHLVARHPPPVLLGLSDWPCPPPLGGCGAVRVYGLDLELSGTGVLFPKGGGTSQARSSQRTLNHCCMQTPPDTGGTLGERALCPPCCGAIRVSSLVPRTAPR